MFPVSFLTYYSEISGCTLLQPVLFILGHFALLGDMASLMDVSIRRKLLIDGGGMKGRTNLALSKKIYYIKGRSVVLAPFL